MDPRYPGGGDFDIRANTPSAYAASAMGASERFQLDKFLLNRKVMSLGNKYYVYNEAQQPLFFVDRPIFKLQAHIGIYEDETRTRKLLTLYQDSPWAFINQSFTLLDANEAPLAYFRRQGWTSLLRRTWHIYDTTNQQIAIAQEDEMWKAVLRRVFKDDGIGFFFRTNYIILRPDGTPFGEFNRRFTITDKHVADFTRDIHRTLDRRIALGLCILLDNVEQANSV